MKILPIIFSVFVISLSTSFAEISSDDLDGMPRARIFEIAQEKSGGDGEAAHSYIRSHQGRMAPYLLAVASDPNFKYRQFAVDLLLTYPYRGNWNEPLEQLYSSDDSVLWKPAIEKRIKFVLEGAKLVNRIGFPDHRGYPLAMHIYFLERCAALIDAGISNHTWGLQAAITDTLPAVHYAALSAVSQLTRYHLYISNAILSTLSRNEDTTYCRALYDIICEKPFLVLPDVITNSVSRDYFYRYKIPARQYLDDFDLSPRQMSDMLVEILSDTSARDQYGIIGHQINVIRALGILGKEAFSARNAVEPFLTTESNQIKPDAVLAMSCIDSDYPGIVQMIGLGILGIEEREKYEIERKKWEEEAANSDGEGCGDGYYGFEKSYKSSRLAYIEAAKNMGLKAQDCGRPLAIAMNEGCFDEAYPVLYSYGEAGMQAFTELIFRCPEVWNRREEMKALMHHMQPEAVLIKQMIDDALTSEQTIGTKWSLVPPLRAARAMNFTDSMVVSAVGSLFTPQMFRVENEQWTAISYLTEVGPSAKYAARGIACAFFYPNYHQRPPITRLILAMGKDAEPVVKCMADLLDSGLVEPISFNNAMGTSAGDDFLDIIYNVGEPAAIHLVKLVASDSMNVSSIGIVGLNALGKRASPAVLPIYEIAKRPPQWRMVWIFTFLSKLKELAWPAFREALVHPDTSPGYQNFTTQAILSIDSLYFNADEVVQDSVRMLIAGIAEKGNDPVHRYAKDKLSELIGNAPKIKKDKLFIK